jgi:SAM-dependent methyltransferase
MNRASAHNAAQPGRIPAAMKAAFRGHLPPRYGPKLQDRYRALIEPSLRPDVRILDVGSGRHPNVLPLDRPAGSHYVGLDISEAELNKAPEGSYDRVVVSDVGDGVGHLSGEFDLILTWFVLEHVKRLDAAFSHMRNYLRPGGRLVAGFPGTFAAFALINKVLPHRIGSWVLQQLFDRDPESTFPAYYDRCWYSALERILRPWERWEIEPYYIGASYFRFSRLLQALYIGYEEWTYRNDRRNLASYYLVTATA